MAANTPPSSAPVHYLVPIFPGFQLLDLTGPLDILNLLSTQPGSPRLTLTLISDSLQPVPTKPIPPAGVEWKFDLDTAFPETGGKVNTLFNQYLTPDTTYSEFLSGIRSGFGETKRPPTVDVLLIPGGVGTRLLRTWPDGSKTSNIQGLLDFIPQIKSYVSTAIITVCTGSYALAQTGILDKRRATTNMERFADVAARNPGVYWQRGARWVRSLSSEGEGPAGLEIWTSAGISAGMDVTLAFVAEYYGGIDVARDLAKELEYDWREIPEGERDPLYEKHFGL